VGARDQAEAAGLHDRQTERQRRRRPLRTLLPNRTPGPGQTKVDPLLQVLHGLDGKRDFERNAC
jgi:hypothetical protein